MKKWTIFPLLITIVLLGSSLSKATYDGILLKESSIYHQLQLKSEHILKNITVVPDVNFDESEAIKIISRIDSLPNQILQEMEKKNLKIILFEGSLTDNASIAYLKGKTPRGHPESVFWDDVPGIGGSKQIFVKIGSSDMGNSHGSVNLEYHEIAHSLQRYVYNDPNNSAEINSIWEKEAALLFPDQYYFLDYEEEYFAESFAYYFLSAETRDILKNAAPETYAFFSRLY